MEFRLRVERDNAQNQETRIGLLYEKRTQLFSLMSHSCIAHQSALERDLQQSVVHGSKSLKWLCSKMMHDAEEAMKGRHVCLVCFCPRTWDVFVGMATATPPLAQSLLTQSSRARPLVPAE